MPTLRIELNREQHRRAKEHAERTGREVEDDIVAVWWGRVRALDDYAEKRATKGAKFAAYAPKLLDEAERDRVKRVAHAAGIATRPQARAAPKKQRASIKEAVRRVLKGPKKEVAAAMQKLAGMKPIALYDSPGVAVFKAGGNVKVLKNVGRDAEGRSIK
jgi:hypothetical protein